MNYFKYRVLLSSALLVVLASSSLPVIGSSLSQDIFTKLGSKRSTLLAKGRKPLVYPHGFHVQAPANRSSRLGGLRGSSCKEGKKQDGSEKQDSFIALLPTNHQKIESNKSVKAQVSDDAELTADLHPTVLFYVPENSPNKARFYLYKENNVPIYHADVQLPNLPDARDQRQNGVVILSLSELAKTKNVPELEVGKNYIWQLRFACNNDYGQIDQESPTISGWISRIDPTTSLKSQLVNDQNLKDDDSIVDQLQKVKPDEYPRVYMENGIWYSAISLLAQLRATNPQDSEIQSEWKSLLNSAELGEIADKPIISLATIERWNSDQRTR